MLPCSQKSSVLASEDVFSADLALHNTGALAAAEHGRLVVWAHSPLVSVQHWASPLQQLDGASVSASHVDRWLVFVFDFAFVFHAFSVSFIPFPLQKHQSLYVVVALFSALVVSCSDGP